MTTARAKELAWPELSGSSQDTLIGIYVASAEAWVAAFLGLPVYDGATERSLDVQTYTLHPTSHGTDVLELGIQPVASVTTVHVSAARDYDANSLVDAGDYTLRVATGELRLDYGAEYATWPVGVENIRAVVTAGFNVLPGPVELAVALVARSMWEDSQRKRAKVTSKSGNGGSTQYAEQTVPEVALTMLRPYRSPLAMLG